MKKYTIIFLFLLFSLIVLEAQVSTATEKFMNIDGEKFHYTDFGQGKEVILCLHGFALSSLSYKAARPHFDSLKYRLIALDLKGFGFSDKPKNSDYTIVKQAQIVEQFLKNLEIEEVHLIGHSYGGMVSIFLNHRQSRKDLNFSIQTTTVIDAPAYNKNIPLFMKVLRNKLGALLLLKIPPAPIQSRIEINGGFYKYRYGMSEYIEVYKKLLGQKEYPYSLHQAAKQAIPDNFKEVSDSYKTFEGPFLIIWGKHDNFISKKHAQGLNRDIKDSRLVLIEETSHNPHEEKPEVVYRLINEFIDSKR